MRNSKNYFKITILVGLIYLITLTTYAVRIKDIASIQGMKENQLVGYGLVVGLNETGDEDSIYTDQSVRSMLEKMGVNIPVGSDIEADNTAAVVVTASLPPFSKIGF